MGAPQVGNYLCHTPAYTHTILTQKITLTFSPNLLFCPLSHLNLLSPSPAGSWLGKGHLELPAFLVRSRSLGELPPSTCGAGSALTPLPSSSTRSHRPVPAAGGAQVARALPALPCNALTLHLHALFLIIVITIVRVQRLNFPK